MKRKTYGNVLKAVKMIQDKGYDRDESNDLALSLFEQHENDVMPIEWYIEKIIPKQEWLSMY